MEYFSTRDKSVSLSAAEAVKMGLSRDGGLLTPKTIPQIDRAFLESLMPMDYAHRAAKVMALYLTDYTEEELLTFGQRAYGPEQFDDPAAAPVRRVTENTYCLELWHGPTSAFKDMALQMLPQLLSAALRKTGEKRTACILAATSGDTGKAAMAGFADVPQTRIQVYYPKDGVSPVQEAQMVTQGGENVDVRAVIGNFDDAQSGVKRIFSDEALRAELDKRGYFLSSANSINIGRLVPQVVYYFSAYADLVKQGRLTPGAKLSFTVPTGNFGDILAGFIAGELGLPIGRLVCASNENNVLTDFLRTGTYDRRRSFYRTLSPSMDILISSNLERLLYIVSGDCELVASLMQQLKTDGFYTVPAELLEKIQSRFWAGCCGDEATEETIREVWERNSYLCDTHTAVAWNVAQQYEKAAESPDPMVVLSTASPYKFPAAVLSAIGAKCDVDEFDMMSALEKVTGVPMPANLRSLRERPVLHTGCVKPGKMRGYVLDLLEGKT